MINRIHSLLHRTERGWDPVPPEYAAWYAEAEWEKLDESVVDTIEAMMGTPLRGKRVIDLGGGPGHYAVAFAKRGASVTWHDVSRNYLDIAKAKAEEAGLAIDFSLGYLEDASRFVDHPFDLVFSRLCWCYSMSDKGFARLIYDLTAPGGACYVDSNVEGYGNLRGPRRFPYFVNRLTGVKIGHPHPPHGRISRLLKRYSLERLIEDYSSSRNDRVFFVKTMGGAT